MTEHRNILANLFSECWKDEALKARFIQDPKTVLAEHGLNVPEGVDVNVLENTDNVVHITLPMSPANMHELSDEELGSAAGGSIDSCGKHSNCTLPDGWAC